MAQWALAWTLTQDDGCGLIPGTLNLQHLEDNLGAAGVVIPDQVLAGLNDAFQPEAIVGPRYSPTAQATVTTERYGLVEGTTV